MLRSQSPAMAEQEIWGYLLTHYAISALTCAAATTASIHPDLVKFKRTVRIIRRAVGPAFPPEGAAVLLARVMADLTRKKNLNPRRRHRSYPRVVKRSPAQPLPDQETRRPRHPPPRAAHDQARQPRPHQSHDQHPSMIKLR